MRRLLDIGLRQAHGCGEERRRQSDDRDYFERTVGV